MKRYFSLLFSLFKISAIADLQFRANIALKICNDLIWYLTQFGVFEVLYRHTNQLKGWGLPEVRTFMGVLFLVDAIYMVLFSENMDALREKVKKGDLDFILSKPINSQFLVSFTKMNTPYFINIMIVTSYFFWAIRQLPGGIPWPRLPLLLMVVPCGIAILYSLRFFFSAISLVITESESLTWLWYQIYKMGTRPDRLYPRWLRYVILSAVPVGFIASVPARIIIDGPRTAWLVTLVGLSTFFLGASTLFWRYALRNYNSASS